MPAHVEHLVLHMWAALTVQARDLILESLPVGLFVLGVEFRVGLVGTADQTEILGSLKIESAAFSSKKVSMSMLMLISCSCS